MVNKNNRTYSQLKELIDGFYQLAHDVSPLNRLIYSFLILSEVESAATKVLIGFSFLGLSPQEGMLTFRSNRYFLDALKISLMPKEEELRSVSASIESKAHEYGIKESIHFLYESFIQNQLRSNITNNIPEIYRKHTMPNLSESDLKFLDDNGYLVINNALPFDLCDRVGERLDELAHFEARSIKGGYFYGSGRLQRIYQLLGKDEIYRQMILHPICDQVMSHMFSRDNFHDKYYLTSFHGNILQPGAEAQIWHVDANVPDPLPPWIIRSNSNYVIQDLSEENGATEIVPGSHKFQRKPNKKEAETHNLETISLCAPKGSLIFWHGHLWHRSGANRTSVNRTAILGAYAASFFREVCMEENHYLYFNQNTSTALSASLKRLLGWEHGVKDYA